MVADSAVRPVARAGPAQRRLARMFARFVSVGYLLYLVVLAPLVIAQAAWMPAWWTPTMVAVAWLPALVLGVATFGGERWIGPTAAVTALTFVVLPVSWLLIDPGVVTSGGVTAATPWMAMMPGLAALAGSLAFSIRIVGVHLVVVCSLCQVVAHEARGLSDTLTLLLDIVFSIGFCSVFVGGAVMAIRTGKKLDRVTVTARRHAAAAAQAQAREAERERFDALVHDGVLSTLLSASAGDVDPRVRRQAAQTLAQIDDLRDADSASHPVTPTEATALLRAAATGADESIAFDVKGAGTQEIPSEVVRVMAAALAEAVRNSVRHASTATRPARRWVVVEIADDALTVLVHDDGVGFDVKRIAHHRMGINVSIIGRMRQLDGGSAQVTSAPAKGTVVALRWAAA